MRAMWRRTRRLRRIAPVPLVVFFAVTILSAVPAQALAGTWRLVASPTPKAPPRDALTAVSCASASSCVAVGSGYGVAMTEVWNGSRWSLVRSPGAVGRALNGVSCVTASNCIAVGSTSSPADPLAPATTLIERWDGTTWTVVPSPNPFRADRSELTGVACPATNNCFAVGYSAILFQAQHGLIEHWNGTAWSIVLNPAPSDGAQTYLAGITCASTKDCVAVGSATSFSDRPFVEHWSGRTWAIVPSPAPAVANGADLNAVSCHAPDDCVAVGAYSAGSDPNSTQHALIERWNGTTWSVDTAPLPAGTVQSELWSVTCPAAQSCTAAGIGTGPLAGTAPQGAPLVESWNGTGWSAATAAHHAGASAAALLGITCVPATSCVAVGAFVAAATGAQNTLVEQRTGSTWAVRASPTRPGPRVGTLAAIACAASTSCFAAGASESGPLVEHWNGSTWTISPNPAQPAGSQTSLNGISCPSASSCFAVGGSFDGLSGNPVVEHWGGSTWQRMPSPKFAPDSIATFTGISCDTPNDCMATGSIFGGGGFTAFTEHWDGTGWQIVSIPLPAGALITDLQQISCASRTDCDAVGTAIDQRFGQSDLIERWDGVAWKLVTGAGTGTGGASLSSVSCASSTACIAVGTAAAGGVNPFGQKPFAERWDGARWSVVAPKSPAGATEVALYGVTCTSATSCYAVGAADDHTLVEAWNGTSWTIEASPNAPASMNSVLGAVACTAPGACIAVGQLSRLVTGITQTIVEQRS